MNSKLLKSAVIFIFLFAGMKVSAQERADSLHTDPTEAAVLFHDLFNFSEQPGIGSLFPELINLNQQYGWKNPLSIQFESYSFGHQQRILWNGGFGNPFLTNFSINSSATYKLNNKLTLTGSSYSANSIFNPRPSINPSQMNFQGVNLYLEYKVSDKFRIGGGFQVNRNSGAY